MQFSAITLFALLAVGISALPAEILEPTVELGSLEVDGTTFYGEVLRYPLLGPITVLIEYR